MNQENKVLTTIFTGHTLDLTDIMSVGPCRTETGPSGISGTYKTLYIEVFFKSGSSIRYNFFYSSYLNAPNAFELKGYREAVATLEKLRTKLVEHWAVAVQASLDPSKGGES